MIYLFRNYKKLNSDKYESLIENVVFNVLNNKFNPNYGDYNIYYFRNDSNSEVDFVVENHKLLVESKYTNNKEKVIEEIDALNNTIKDKFSDYKKVIVTNDVDLKYSGWIAIPLKQFLKEYK